MIPIRVHAAQRFVELSKNKHQKEAQVPKQIQVASRSRACKIAVRVG